MNDLKFLSDYKNVRTSTVQNELEVLAYGCVLGTIIALVNHAN